jgi:hypothetical protein
MPGSEQCARERLGRGRTFGATRRRASASAFDIAPRDPAKLRRACLWLGRAKGSWSEVQLRTDLGLSGRRHDALVVIAELSPRPTGTFGGARQAANPAGDLGDAAVGPTRRGLDLRFPLRAIPEQGGLARRPPLPTSTSL